MLNTPIICQHGDAFILIARDRFRFGGANGQPVHLFKLSEFERWTDHTSEERTAICGVRVRPDWMGMASFGEEHCKGCRELWEVTK